MCLKICRILFKLIINLFNFSSYLVCATNLLLPPVDGPSSPGGSNIGFNFGITSTRRPFVCNVFGSSAYGSPLSVQTISIGSIVDDDDDVEEDEEVDVDDDVFGLGHKSAVKLAVSRSCELSAFFILPIICKYYLLKYIFLLVYSS